MNQAFAARSRRAPDLSRRRAPHTGIVVIFCCVAALTLLRCSTDTRRSTAPLTPPAVTGSEPADLATGIDPAAPILIQFNQAIDPATLTDASIGLVHRGRSVPLARSYEPLSARAELAPSEALEPGVPYTIQVTREVTDTAGQALLQSYGASFITAGDGAPGVPDGVWLHVRATDPGAGDTLRVYASERGVIARGLLVCHGLGLPVSATVTGIIDEELQFVAGGINGSFSMLVEGAFGEQGERWCLTGNVRIHAETPDPHRVCDETRSLGSICR